MLDLRIYEVGKVEWSPQRTVPLPDVDAIKDIPSSQLKAELGWQPLHSQLPDAAIVDSQWLPPMSSYFADFAPGAMSRYRLGREGKTFAVSEQRIREVYEPFTFIYPPHVTTIEVDDAGGRGLIVLPSPGQGVISFAVWTRDDRLIQIFFEWNITKDEAQSIVSSLFK